MQVFFSLYFFLFFFKNSQLSFFFLYPVDRRTRRLKNENKKSIGPPILSPAFSQYRGTVSLSFCFQTRKKGKWGPDRGRLESGGFDLIKWLSRAPLFPCKLYYFLHICFCAFLRLHFRSFRFAVLYCTVLYCTVLYCVNRQPRTNSHPKGPIGYVSRSGSKAGQDSIFCASYTAFALQFAQPETGGFFTVSTRSPQESKALEGTETAEKSRGKKHRAVGCGSIYKTYNHESL